jgi:hypothetical protein
MRSHLPGTNRKNLNQSTTKVAKTLAIAGNFLKQLHSFRKSLAMVNTQRKTLFTVLPFKNIRQCCCTVRAMRLHHTDHILVREVLPLILHRMIQKILNQRDGDDILRERHRRAPIDSG